MTTTTTQRCASCEPALYWLKHVRTGNAAPIEVEGGIAGNIAVDLDAGTWRIVPPAHRYEYEVLYFNHYAHCPQASAWRKAGRTA
jgi:hypothetical protein